MKKIAIVGGGLAGLCSAIALLHQNWNVTLFDFGERVTDVAAGMVTPASELAPIEKHWVKIFQEAALFHSRFLQMYHLDSLSEISQTNKLSLAVAIHQDGAAELRRWCAQMKSLGFSPQEIDPSQAQEREPSLQNIIAAASVRDEYALDPRALRQSLLRLLQSQSAFHYRREHVQGVSESGELICSSHQEKLSFDRVLVATGYGEAPLLPLPQELRGVKGQIITLQGPANFLHCPVRVWDRYTVYLVPRHDGRLVIGATCEERQDKKITVEGITDLLFAASNAIPEISEFQILEMNSGLRPATPDNMPIVGELYPSAKIFILGGLYRHGILLAPFLAHELAALISNAPSTLNWHQLSQQRFRKVA